METQLGNVWTLIEGEDSMPRRRKMVLLFIPDIMSRGSTKYQIGYRGDERFLDAKGKVLDGKPTHWSALPNPPDSRYQEVLL